MGSIIDYSNIAPHLFVLLHNLFVSDFFLFCLFTVELGMVTADKHVHYVCPGDESFCMVYLYTLYILEVILCITKTQVYMDP